MRILDALRAATETLERAGIDDPLADAEILTWHTADIDRLTAFLDNPEISPQILARIRRLTTRRAKGEPVQYIVGQVEFCGLKISVGKGVLIPRPETELLVEEAVKAVIRQPASLPARILDLCTGSGCIALALAKEFPTAKVIGTDISQKALRYAKKNASANNITNVTFMKGSLFAPIKRGTTFDLITANPPYILSCEIPGLQTEVRDWEPHGALDGGNDGIDFYREIFNHAGSCLKPAGSLFMELGYGQAKAVAEIASRSGFEIIAVIRDLAGIQRILHAAPAGPS
ncbi:MAG: peptide chain release factor N(5)-glutamine methyltransferase [Thermodesulfovibrio sp.]|nr:peptide chain release factor N(5)-glutamine methyltransferase [Thermodesulfovibrio sp.]